MKLNYISLAVAAAFAAGGNYAAAVTQDVWATGASAPTRAEYNAFAANCSSAGISIYMNSNDAAVTQASRPGDSKTGNFFRYTCTFDPVKTAVFHLWDNDVVNMYHTVDGGSFLAFAPHLPSPSAVSRINPTLAGCTPASGTPAGGVTVFKNCAKTAVNILDVPHGGFADVEDELWPTLNQNTNFAHQSANVAQLFGVVATDELYKAMQAKQIADGEMAATCVTGDFTPGACQPNINHDEYRSIISQGAGGAWHNNWAPLVGAAGASKVVRVCRRVESSGTQASSTAYFLENPCRQWVTSPGLLLPATNGDDAVGAYDVVENSGTGDVKACLTNSNGAVGFDGIPGNADDVFTSFSAAVNGPAGNYVSTAATNFAIGVVSAENIVAASDKFKYLKLDGVSPNVDAKQRAAGAKGKYGFVMEMAYFAKPGTGKEGFFDELANDMADPALLDLAGVFVLPTAPSAPAFDGDKVGRGAKFGNNCQPLQLFF